MDTAIGYTRVSTDEQTASGLGKADQWARIEAYCALRRLELSAIIADNAVAPLRRCDGASPRRLSRQSRSRSPLSNRAKKHTRE